jgi:hypothetical protein
MFFDEWSKMKIFNLLLILTISQISGCATTRAYHSPYTGGSILLLPPRDVVQNEEFHQAGSGSGSFLQQELISQFSDSEFTLIATSNEAFNNLQVASEELVLEEAKNLKVDYYLQIVLGEFLNAAPFTFRTDYVCLDSAIMYDVKTKQIVWQLEAPMAIEKNNIGNHFDLLREFASVIAESIRENQI